MRTRRNLTRYSKQRATLSDMLPFETPPSFNNGGFFNFLSGFNVRITEGLKQRYVEWDCEDERCDAAIALILGIQFPFIACVETSKEFGRSFKRHKVPLSWDCLKIRPFHFEIAHKEIDSRRLTVIHPRNQLEVANFYHDNSELITYFTSLSPYSLRKPASVAKDVFFDDKLHRKRLGERAALREESHKEYQYLASYFTYEKYSNIFRFYESYGYHKAERSYSKLLKLDISKCFDSIYTHSLPSALLGNQATKDNLSASKATFGGRFDALLQGMNNGETNRIVIGPEFSRIFAELVLQRVDNGLMHRLKTENKLRHQEHYRIFRYVDDFFVFYKNTEDAKVIERHLTSILREFKLNLNSSKALTIEKPIITNLTIAKSRVHSLLAARVEQDYVTKKVDGREEPIDVFSPKVKANKLIVEFKTILRETDTTYQENLNYSFAAIERAFKAVCSKFRTNRRDLAKLGVDLKPDEQTLITALVGLLEFSFFIYSSAQRVNFTVRLTRSICSVVDSLNEFAIADDLKNQFFKYAHDNIVRILKSNRVESYREIETLYLILALKKLGRNHRIEVHTLANYFGFEKDGSGDYRPTRPMNIFSVTVLLLLLRNTKRYSRLKIALEDQLVDTLGRNRAYSKIDAEMTMLYLDVITCPFVSDATKEKLDTVFDMTADGRNSIKAINSHWFTNWRNFDLSLELDKKRARQVY